MLKRYKSFLGVLVISSCVLHFFLSNRERSNVFSKKGIQDIKHLKLSILEEAHDKTEKAADNTDTEIHVDTQMSRKNKILEFCKSHPNMRHINYVNGHYYPRGPFYYCSVPKLGTTFLSDFFRQALGGDDIDAPTKFIKYELKDVFAYINVGDPYSRLFSAYKDKLYKPDIKFWNKLGRDIVKTVRTNAKKTSGFDVTFKELVQYVVNYHKIGKVLNQHLEPIHKLCNPCATHFDFISKKEMLSQDLVNLFDLLKNSSIVKEEMSITKIQQDLMIRAKHGYRSVSKMFEALQAYPNIPAHKLFLRHWSMFHIGGYMLNKYEMPFNESVIKSVSAKQYEEALITAIDKSEGYKEELKLQRYEALVQTYRSVPLELMSQLRGFVKTDCMLFSYDDKPAFLFDRETFNDTITHVYMKGI